MKERISRKFSPDWCPEPVVDDFPDFVNLYWKAWALAWDHVKKCEGMPQSPFMDEGFANDRIWIWDTCFMVHFCKYAPDYFPGIESFDNFYQAMHDGVVIPLKMQHPDNPPLFAWIEYEYYKLTGDASRISGILLDKQYLQKHYEFIENVRSGQKPDYAVCEMTAQKEEFGFRWTGCPNGMDNTPRGRDDYDLILWVDLMAQQALSADCISRLAETIGADDIAGEYRQKSQQYFKILNEMYWDDEDGCYYDIKLQAPYDKVKIKTPASFWPMIAGAVNSEQAQKLEALAKDRDVFGGAMPWPSIARNDEDFCDDGRYWRGGIWLPTAYMATKALNRYGFLDTASELAQNLLSHMSKTYISYEPHTIWECYSPTSPTPSSAKAKEQVCRPDFCGWSALGPISMLIEDVIGFYDIDAIKNQISWNKHLPGRHGIRRLKFGGTITDIIADGNQISVSSTQDYSLVINGKVYEVKKGEQTFVL